MNTFESQPYRDNLAKEIKGTPKDKRGAVLDGAKEMPEYWQTREEKIEDRQREEEINEGLGIFVKEKTLYHGSPVSGIESFNHATDDTVGKGIYFTSETEEAIKYARKRTKDYGKEGDSPIIYESMVENMKLLDLRKSENIKKILPGFRDFLKKILQDKKLDWKRQGVIENALTTMNETEVRVATLSVLTANVGLDFSEYVKTLGYDGLITYEGGEGEEAEEHDTFVIFDPEKARIVQEHKIV
jgi:hypothetical protein